MRCIENNAQAIHLSIGFCQWQLSRCRLSVYLLHTCPGRSVLAQWPAALRIIFLQVAQINDRISALQT